MNFFKINHCDIANGIGVRVSLWCAGCSHHCKECHNPETWNAANGKTFTEKDMNDLISYLSPSYIEGLTLTGGDPLFIDNRECMTSVAKKVKEIYPNKTIWCYTGYKFEDIKDLEILKYIDVLVDGEFEIEKKDITLTFRGSSNQRLIDVPKTLKTGSVELFIP